MTNGMLDREWAISFDNEAGPGWDYVVVIPGYENIMGLAKEVAERIVDDHNKSRAAYLRIKRCLSGVDVATISPDLKPRSSG